MGQLEELLAGPEFFDCERLKARIGGRQCRINQDRARKLQEKGEWLGHLEHCRECPEGEKVRITGGTPVPLEARPTGRTPVPLEKMDGGRGGPPHQEKRENIMPGVERQKGVTVVPGFCPRHPENAQVIISGNGPRAGQLTGKCSICHKENAAKARAAKFKGGGRERPPHGKKRRASSMGRQAYLLNLDFNDYPDLLERLLQEAREQFRTIEAQAMFLISAGLGRGNAPAEVPL